MSDFRRKPLLKERIVSFKRREIPLKIVKSFYLLASAIIIGCGIIDYSYKYLRLGEVIYLVPSWTLGGYLLFAGIAMFGYWMATRNLVERKGEVK
jgi:MFS superfamily sulfate permease-like transporter